MTTLFPIFFETISIIIPLEHLMSFDWLKAMQHMEWSNCVLFELSNIGHVTNIGQETAQHLTCDLAFVVSDKMTQINIHK